MTIQEQVGSSKVAGESGMVQFGVRVGVVVVDDGAQFDGRMWTEMHALGGGRERAGIVARVGGWCWRALM